MGSHTESGSSAMSSRYFQSDGVRLFGIVEGAGQPVIFLHGITANAYVWLPIVERLAGRCLAVSLDQRGHGRSDRPESSYTARELSGDVAAVIEELGQGPAIVVGHSLGARNAITVADLFPDHVKGIVAVEFGPYIEDAVFDRLTDRVKGGDRQFDSLDEAKEYLQGRYRLLPPDAIERRAKHGLEPTPEGKLRPLADPGAMAATSEGLREDVTEPFRRLACPAIVVRGEESAFVSQAAFERMSATRPELPHELVPGADHYVPEIAPETISDMVAGFLDDVG